MLSFEGHSGKFCFCIHLWFFFYPQEMKRTFEEFSLPSEPREAHSEPKTPERTELLQDVKLITLTELSSLRTFFITSCPLSLLTECAKEIMEGRESLLIEKPPFMCYGKLCHQQRDVGFFSDLVEQYRYSKETFPAKPLSAKMGFIMQEVNKACQSKFNGILVNLYNNGEKCISAHSDDEKELDPQAGVVTISIGAVRKFRLRDKQSKKIIYETDLINGSCLQMLGACQKELTHEIPKEKGVISWRLSLTFRQHKAK